jgi:hypothetical protein
MEATITIDNHLLTVRKTGELWVYLVTCKELNLHVNVASHGAMRGRGKIKHRLLIEKAIREFEKMPISM